MTQLELTKDSTADMRLILRISHKQLSALIVGPEAIEPIVGSISEELTDNSVKALENAVYDNSLLLGDFAATDIILSTPELFLIPSANVELLEETAAALLPDYETPRSVMSEAINEEVTLGYVADSDLLNFLKRTFASARFHHSLSVSAQWLLKNEPAGMYGLVNEPGDMALCSFVGDSTLRYLNLVAAMGSNDCAYYLLVAADGDETISLMTVDPEMRATISDTITKVKPSTQLTAAALPEALLYLRRKAPQIAFDMLFITQL